MLKMWEAASFAGVSPEEFFRMKPRQFAALLDLDLCMLELKEQRGQPQRVFQPKHAGGRLPGSFVDGQQIRKHRGKWSQEDFAGKCGVSEDTIQRGERGERWSDATFEAVATTINQLNGTDISPQDLKHRKN